MRDPSRVNVAGPLEPFAAGFADWLARHGYTQYLSLKALQPMLASLQEQGLIVMAPPAIHGPVDAALIIAPRRSNHRLAGRRRARGRRVVIGRTPKGVTPAAVHALVASYDRRTRLGRRDYAVLTMPVRLGVRAGELAALRLDDIDWRNGAVMLRGKGHQVESIPVPIDVGEAIAAYVCRGRPATATERTVRAPPSTSSRSQHQRRDSDCRRGGSSGGPRCHPCASLAT